MLDGAGVPVLLRGVRIHHHDGGGASGLLEDQLLPLRGAQLLQRTVLLLFLPGEADLWRKHVGGQAQQGGLSTVPLGVGFKPCRVDADHRLLRLVLWRLTEAAESASVSIETINPKHAACMKQVLKYF